MIEGGVLMSLDYVKFSGGFEKFMPKEYRDMVEHGPFGKKIDRKSTRLNSSHRL